jgi:hypothetical protein
MIDVMLTAFIPLFLLFPDGGIPSPRWRPALWLTIAGPAITVVSFALTPGRMTGAFAELTTVRVVNPFGVEALEAPLHVASLVGGLMCAAAAILAGFAISARYRGASPEVRQQIRWIRFVAVAFLVELAGTVVAGIAGGSGDNPIGDIMFMAMFVTLAVGIPVASGIAILKYRLYDLDLVIRKTVVVGAMALFIALVYAVIVGLGTQLFDSSALSFAAAVVLALAFQPSASARGGWRIGSCTASGRRRTRSWPTSPAAWARRMRRTTFSLGWRRCSRRGRGPRSRSFGSASATSSSRLPCSPPTRRLRRLHRTTPSTSSTRESASARSPSPCRPPIPWIPRATSSWKTSRRRRASCCGTSV